MEKIIELQLKELILSRYKSVREFALSAKIPTSTLATIFERGIKNAGINTVFQICDALNIDIDKLMVNQIAEKHDSPYFVVKDNSMIAVTNGGKRIVYELTEEQLKILIDMANALTKK